jgi:hypothetical protein
MYDVGSVDAISSYLASFAGGSSFNSANKIGEAERELATLNPFSILRVSSCANEKVIRTNTNKTMTRFLSDKILFICKSEITCKLVINLKQSIYPFSGIFLSGRAVLIKMMDVIEQLLSSFFFYS